MTIESKNSQVRVLHVLHDARWSGLPAQAYNIFTNLDQKKIHSSVLFASEGVYARLAREKGLRVSVFARRLPLLWRLNRFLFNIKLVSLLKKVDIVHIYSCTLASTVLLAKRMDAKVVFHVVENPKLVSSVLRRALAEADCVVYCGEGNAEHFASYPTRRKKIIPNAIVVNATESCREATHPPRIVQMATIHQGKGQDLLLQAFARLKNRDAELYIYGSVGLSKRGFYRSLQQFIKDNGLSTRVFFPGIAPDSEKVFREASIWVHPSRSEGLPLVLLEAMSYNLPIITHDAPGMKEIVEDGVTGFLVPLEDIDALAERIDHLLSDPELRRKMGEAGRQRVLAQFDVRSRAEEFEDLYLEISERQAGRGKGA